jgi:hypothetical protein
MAADKDDVSAAIAKLAAADNYSWKTTTTNIPAPGADANGGGMRRGGRGGGPTDGKAQKDGLLYVSMAGRGGAVTEGYVKGTKGAIKTGDDTGWTSLAAATADDGGGGGGFNPAAMAAQRVQNTKSPADAAKDLLSKTKSVAKTGDFYTAELTEVGAKSLVTSGFGGMRGGPGGGGGDGPDITGAKGTAKFWVKDGALSKYETDVQGSIDFGGNTRDMHPVTTIEIREVGTTKIDVPADAKKNL